MDMDKIRCFEGGEVEGKTRDAPDARHLSAS